MAMAMAGVSPLLFLSSPSSGAALPYAYAVGGSRGPGPGRVQCGGKVTTVYHFVGRSSLLPSASSTCCCCSSSSSGEGLALYPSKPHATSLAASWGGIHHSLVVSTVSEKRILQRSCMPCAVSRCHSSSSKSAVSGRRRSAGMWMCRAELKSKSTDVEESSSPSIPSFSVGGDGSGSGSAEADADGNLVGEDAGVFSVQDQKTSSWVYFTLILGVVLAVLYVIWLDPNTGLGGPFVDFLYSINSNHEVVMLELLFIFALVHSGGASIRANAEKVMGERAYRVLFAGISLPLAVSAVVYFINHRYDGQQLWQLRTVPGVEEFCWVLSFISFLFLYPSTFNLLEVAAVDKPKVHMYETGIMRITRHPQMVGQLLWCVAHTLWIGNSFTLTTSLGLLAHHLFGVWHGDRRLATKYGEAFEVVKKRTSVIPFAAIAEGRQRLPPDYYKEFLRLPYYVIVAFTVGTYFAHPLMQISSHWLHW